MSHTNTTTNYGLPQFLSSDKPAWMADINVAFADIDSQMKTNADAASAAQSTADDAVLNGAPGYSNLSTYAVGDVVNYLGRVYKCDIAVTTPEAFDNAKWSYYRLSDASAQLDVIDGEIGSTDISGIGDGSITGAISDVDNNLPTMYHRTYTNSGARYDIMATTQNGHRHIEINVAGEALSDSGFLYPTLEIPPSNQSTILGLARCTDGTTTDCIITLKTNGDMQLSLYNYGSKTVSGIMASGFYD